MPPTCGHRNDQQQRCGLLQGHATYAYAFGNTSPHQYVDTPESLALRGGAAASDQRVVQAAEDEELLRSVARVALADCVRTSRSCRLCYANEHHDERCPLYTKQLETRLVRVNRLKTEQRREVSSLETAVADLEAEQNRQSEQVRRLQRQVAFLEGESNRLRRFKLGDVSREALLRELLRRETEER